MRAQILNESRLMLYKFPDGTYEATRDGHLYTYNWNPRTSQLYNLKHIGGFNKNWHPQGTLIRKPSQQMIIKVQQEINSLFECKATKVFEDLTKTFKPKDISGVEKEAWDLRKKLEDFGFKVEDPKKDPHGIISVDFFPDGHSYSSRFYYIPSEVMADAAKMGMRYLDEWHLSLGKGNNKGRADLIEGDTIDDLIKQMIKKQHPIINKHINDQHLELERLEKKKEEIEKTISFLEKRKKFINEKD